VYYANGTETGPSVLETAYGSTLLSLCSYYEVGSPENGRVYMVQSGANYDIYFEEAKIPQFPGEDEPPGGSLGNGDQDLGDIIEDVRAAVKIPEWGFWLIILSLGMVAVGAVFAKAPRRTKSRSYQPQKRASQERRLPKRDREGRFRRR